MPKDRLTPDAPLASDTPTVDQELVPESEVAEEPVTEENLLDHPKAKPHQLHAYTEKLIDEQDADRGQDINPEDFQPIVEHPNTSTDTLHRIYERAFPPIREKEWSSGSQDKLLGAMFRHPNFSAKDAEHFVDTTHNISGLSDLTEEAAKHPGVNKQFLKDLTEHTGTTGTSYLQNIEPEYFIEKLKSRPQYEPVTDNMTNAQKENNIKVDRLNAIALAGLQHTNLHNPQNTNEVFNLLHEQRQDSIPKTKINSFFGNYIDKNPHVTHQQLEKLFNDAKTDSSHDSWSDYELKRKVLIHPNIDPSFLARVAMMSEHDPLAFGDDYKDTEIKALAASSPRLPQEVRNKIIDSITADENTDISSVGVMAKAMAEHPEAKPEDIKRIYLKGIKSAINAQNAPQDLIEEEWNKVPERHKNTNAARETLKAQNIPPSVLADIVKNHKNTTLAVDALNHANSDESVVNAALKRRSKVIQEAVLKHPKVPRHVITEKLKSGGVSGHDYIWGSKEPTRRQRRYGVEHSAELDSDQINHLNERYKGFSPESIASSEGSAENAFDKYLKVKIYLASSNEVPGQIQAENKHDIVRKFKDMVPPGHYVGYGDSQGTENRIKKLVHNFADDGDQHAQEAILLRPRELTEANLDKPTYSHDFLIKAHKILTGPTTNNKDVISGNTNLVNTDSRESLAAQKNIAMNPNASNELFREITLSPNFLGSYDSFLTEGSGGWGRNRSDGATVFDEHTKDKPEEYRRQVFQQLTDTNHPNANYAVLVSKNCPKDIWNEAWDKSSSENKAEVSDNFDLSRRMDHHMKLDAMAGRYIIANNESAGQKIIKFILAGLSSEDPLDRRVLDAFIDQYISGSIWSSSLASSLGSKDIIGNLDHKWFTPEKMSPILDKLSSSRSSMARLGPKIIATTADNLVDKYKSGVNREESINKSLEFIASSIEKNAGAFPGISREDEIASRWGDLLDSDAGQKYARNISHFAKSTGKLDFLADLPGDTLVTTSVQDKAMILGLISPDKLKSLFISNPKSFVDALTGRGDTSLGESAKREVMHNVIGSKSLSPELLDTVVDMANPRFLLPSSASYNRTRTSDATKAKEIEYVKNNLNDLIGHIFNSGPLNESADKILTLRKNLSKGSPASQGGLYINEVSALESFIADTVNNRISQIPGMSDADKIDVMFRSGVLSSGELQKMITKSDDPKLALKFLDRVDDPEKFKPSIKKLANQTSQLDYSALQDLSRVSSQNFIDFKEFKKINDAFFAASDAKLNTRRDAFESLHRMWKPTTEGSPDQEAKNQYILDKLLFNQSNSDFDIRSPALTSLARGLHTNSPLNDEQKKQIFLGIKDTPESQRILNDAAILPGKMINDPDIIESAKGGWRLEAFMIQARMLSADTASVITNRVLNDEKIDLPLKRIYAKSLVENPNVKAEDLIKITRKISSPPDLLAYLGSNNFSAERLVESSAHQLFDLFSNHLKDLYEGREGIPPGGQPFDLEHVVNILKDTQGALSIVSAYENSRNLLKWQEKQEKVDKLADHALEGIQKTLDAVIQNVSSVGGHDPSIPIIASSALKKSSFCLEKMFGGDRIYNENHSRKSLELLKKIEDLAKECNTVVPVAQNYPHAFDVEGAKSSILTDWARKSKVSDDDWTDLYEMHPELPEAISVNRNIPMAAIESLPLQRIFESDTKEESKTIGRILGNAALLGRAKVFPKILEEAEKFHENYPDKTVSSWQPLRAAFSACLGSCPEALTASRINKIQENLGETSHGKDFGTSTALFSGAGGREFFDQHANKLNEQMDDKEDLDSEGLEGVKNLARSPHLKPDDHDFFLKAIRTMTHSGDETELKEILAGNPKCPPNLLKWMTPSPKTVANSEISKKLAKNPNLPEAEFRALSEALSSSHLFDPMIYKIENPAYKNAKYGGQQLRKDLNDFFPDNKDLHVDPDLLIHKTSYSPQRQRLNQILQKVPAEGISWADFKKQNKGMENWPETRKLFQIKMGSAEKVTPEDVAETAKSFPGNEFHVSYSLWDGAQRHTDKPNLVMQLNTSAETEEMLKDPKVYAFFQLIQKTANYSSHPNTPITCGWVRVDTSSGKKGWIVEEFQSDFSSRLRKELDEASSQCDIGGKISEECGMYFTPEEIYAMGDKMADILKHFYHSALMGIEELAKKQGVEHLYIHGEGIRASLSGMDTNRELPVKLKEFYGKEPPKFGYEPCDYSDYPNWSKKRLEEVNETKAWNTKCWKKKLR